MSEDRIALAEALTQHDDVVKVLQATWLRDTLLNAFLEANTRLNTEAPVRSVRSRLGQKTMIDVIEGAPVGTTVGTTGASSKFRKAQAEGGSGWLTVLLSNGLPSESALIASVLWESDGMARAMKKHFPDVHAAVSTYMQGLRLLAEELYETDVAKLKNTAHRDTTKASKVSEATLDEAKQARKEYMAKRARLASATVEKADGDWTIIKGIGPATAEAIPHRLEDMRDVVAADGPDGLRQYLSEHVNSRQLAAIAKHLA